MNFKNENLDLSYLQCRVRVNIQSIEKHKQNQNLIMDAKNAKYC